jgi:hypothetical protein
MAVEKQRWGEATAGQAGDHVEAVGVVTDELSGYAGFTEHIPAICGTRALVAGRVGGVEADELPEELGYGGSDSG